VFQFLIYNETLLQSFLYIFCLSKGRIWEHLSTKLALGVLTTPFPETAHLDRPGINLNRKEYALWNLSNIEAEEWWGDRCL
jgi:hypothetical protein